MNAVRYYRTIVLKPSTTREKFLSRPREFDPDAVLERAMRVFWRQGYHATSVEELVTATGVNRASLYATFGDKHALFVASIARYAETNLAVLRRTLHDAARAVDGIRAVVEIFAPAATPRGAKNSKSRWRARKSRATCVATSTCRRPPRTWSPTCKACG
jgi:TetR/AcrR family transcriptional repressor of nem operon